MKNNNTTMRRIDEAVSVSVILYLIIISCYLVNGVQILSKSKLEKCEKSSDSNDNLNCTRKIVLNMAVPSGTSGREASIVAEIVEVEQNSTNKMQTLRIPPVITVNKSAAFSLYELTYIRDVPYKPQEFYHQTRKCEPDADAKVVQICERLRDDKGHVLKHTEPVCCPCGDRRRVPSSCGNFFDKMIKGKKNTAHCLRFPGDWFHVFGIGRRSIGFSVRIEVKTESKISEVIVGPENQTATSNDNFLRANLVGDFAGYTNIPAFEDFYLVTPRQGGPGQPQNLGRNFSMWMLLERVRFTLDGLECNKIGVSYEAFNGQPDFCSAPFWSCLHNQLWNFHEADENRIKRHQGPLYGVEKRFERINEHPDAGPQSFSIGITEALNTNLLIELRADDIEYVYQRSPGKILGIVVPTFEALAQSGIATITATNVGEVEASYSLTFQCSKGVTVMEEQFFIMKPQESTIRSFTLSLMTDQAAKYVCSAILKDSEFHEVDRAECQFTTTATTLDNGTQGPPFEPPKSNTEGFFDYVKNLWKKFWDGLIDFVTGKSCRSKCSGFFDFRCHIQYVCMSWVVMFGLFLAIFPTVLVLIWLLHQKGLFDPCYDWWEDHCFEDPDRYRPTHRHGHYQAPHERHHKHRRQRYMDDDKDESDDAIQALHDRYHKHGRQHYRDCDDESDDAVHNRRRRIHGEHRRHHLAKETDYNHYTHHAHKDKHKHGHHRRAGGGAGHRKEVNTGHHRHRKERKATKQPANLRRNRKDVDNFNEEFDGMFDRHAEMHRHRRRD